MRLPYDVCRCANKNCKLKESCARYMQAKRDKADKNAIWVSYAAFEPIGNTCEFKIKE